MAFAPMNEGEVERHSSRVIDGYEDDEAFWGYVSDARAELTTNPLTFPIPRIRPTIESDATVQHCT